MTITVLVFASYAEALGLSSLELEMPTPSTVSDLIQHLRSFPGAERLPERPLVAVNQQYAALGTRISAGDEVAVIPPVAGG